MKDLKTVLFHFLKVLLLCWVVYILSSQLLNILFYSDQNTGENKSMTPIFWCMHVIFFISYYLIYQRYMQKNDKLQSVENFDFKNTIITFIKEERLQIIVLSTWAIINECMLLVSSGRNIILTLTLIFLPSSAAISIPIVRTLIALIITIISMSLSDLILKYKNYKFWNKKQ